MKLLVACGVVLIVLSSNARAEGRDRPQTESACGMSDVNFRVRFAKNQSALPHAGNPSDDAFLYIIEQYVPYDKGHLGQPTIRQGVDGKWIGATQGLSYVTTPVAPGLHHLCSQWQSHVKKLSALVSLNSFTAEPRRSYFFLAQIQNDGAPLTLQQLSNDEGLRLIHEAPISISTQK